MPKCILEKIAHDCRPVIAPLTGTFSLAHVVTTCRWWQRAEGLTARAQPLPLFSTREISSQAPEPCSCVEAVQAHLPKCLCLNVGPKHSLLPEKSLKARFCQLCPQRRSLAALRPPLRRGSWQRVGGPDSRPRKEQAVLVWSSALCISPCSASDTGLPRGHSSTGTHGISPGVKEQPPRKVGQCRAQCNSLGTALKGCTQSSRAGNR